MDKSPFEIGATGVDTAALVEEIRARVAERMANGEYTDARVAAAERTNLANLQSEEDFLSFYLDCLREAVFVDITDFEILERRQRFTKFLVVLKRTIWNLLRFYTYRLWSQQNQVNGLLLAAVEGTESRSRRKIGELEARIRDLEAKNAESDATR